MSTLHLVDLVLVALVLAYARVAIWRGGFREGVLGGGLVFTGALIIAPPVNMLQAAADGQGVVGRIVVAFGCLSVGLAIGLGAGRIVERHAATARGRVLGGICGLANSLWVLTFLLVELKRMSGQTGFGGRFRDVTVFGPLVTHNEVALLTLSTLVLLLSGLWTVHLLWARLGAESASPARGTPHPRAATRHRAIALPVGADTGKLEPATSGSSGGLANTVALGRHAVLRRSRGDNRRSSWSTGSGDLRSDNPWVRDHPTDSWYIVKRPDESESAREDQNA